MAAESVGLAASVAGIVSLGLQIAGGIIKYVDAFENRSEELEFVKQQGGVLKAVLRALDTHLKTQDQSMPAPDAVVRSMHLFQKELVQVQALHSKLADSDTQDRTSRITNRKKKFTYAFNRSGIQELGLRLQKAGDALQLSLNLLGLQVLRQNAKTLTAMESSAQGISSELSLVRSEVVAIETPIVKIKDEVHLLRVDVDSNKQLLVSQYNNLLGYVQGSRNDVLRSTQETNDRWAQLQSTRDQELARRYEEMINKSAANMMKQIGQMLEDLQQKDVQIPVRAALVRGLSSKPSLLKTLSDEVSSSTQRNDHLTRVDLRAGTLQKMAGPAILPYPSKATMRIFCTCPRLWTVTNRKRIQVAHACFSKELGTAAHWPTCPMAKMKHTQRTALGIKYDGLVSILNKAVSLSFAMTSGAGGFSISSNIALSVTVDDDCDPAFRILSLIGEGLNTLRRRNAEPFLKACTTRLSRLLDDRKVCATAVDRRNMGLMHHSIIALDELLTSWYGAMDRGAVPILLVDLVRMLLSYGVPAFAHDLEGASPLAYLNLWFFDSHISQNVIDVLIQANSESQIFLLNPEREYSKYRDSGSPFPLPTFTIKSLYKTSLGFAEISECGALSLMVIQDDVVGVEHILSLAPGLISEIDVFGQTPFHLAVGKPAILEILLRHRDRKTLDRRDMSGFTALETAMVSTSFNCDNGSNTKRCDANECRCCQCVDLFFGVDCDIRMHELTNFDRAPELGRLLTQASELARRKYVYHMKSRRNPAIRNPSSQAEKHQLGKEIAGPHRQHEIMSATDFAGGMSWIFLEINDPHIGALFFRHGFRPHPSLLDYMRPDLFSSSGFSTMNHFYLHWLVSHGADLFARSSKGPALSKDYPNIGLFGAHFAFYFISLNPRAVPSLHHYGGEDGRSRDTYTDIVTTVCRQNLTDGCECHCTADGCSPFTLMMKRSLGSQTWNSPKERDQMVETIMEHYSRCDFELTSLTSKAAIRYATFEALGLVHTCCNASSPINHDEFVDRDDVHIVNEEQAPLLKTFEALVEDFEDIALQFIGVDSRGGNPFTMFWDLYWKRQIEEELETLEGNELTNTERRGAEEIGIQWTVSDSQQGTEKGDPYSGQDSKQRKVSIWEQRKDTGNTYSWRDPYHWYYELDRICPEYAEPWPDESRRFIEPLV